MTKAHETTPLTSPQEDPHSEALTLSFHELGLSAKSLRAIQDAGYEQPTPVQIGAVPPALEGHDLMVQSQTGTGKTAAFSLPLIEQISARRSRAGVSALILAPTRELAGQVAQEMVNLSRHHDLSVCTVYGGTPFDPQVEAIKQADVIVGTPGRVVDHLKRRTLNLATLKHFVLDEADEMLSMGFAEELEQVRKRLPQARQTLFFSATFPPAVKRYAERTLHEPLTLSFLSEVSSADDLTHAYYLVKGLGRTSPLVKIISQESPANAIIFVDTRRDCELVAKALNRAGFDADRLSGDMDQPERERVMRKMKAKTLRFLVATDVAARGIDISQLSHVFHYQLPDTPEVYIHRSGRTGRAGERGTVISLIGPQELGVLYALKRFHHLEIQERPLPTATTPTTPTATTKSSPPPQRSAHPLGERRAEPKPERRAEPKPERRVEPKPERRVEPKPERRVEPKPERRVEPKPERRVEPKPERRVEPKPELSQGLLSSLQAHLKRLDPQRHRAEASALLQHPEALELVRALIETTRHAPTPALAPAPAPAPKRAQKSARATHSEPKRDTLTLNLGRRELKTPHALRSYIAELAGLLPEDIQGVQMKQHNSLIEVTEDFSSDLIEAIQGEPFHDKLIEVTRLR